MYILKNALLSIKRNIGRNILIGIIVIVISCFLTITLAIKNTSDSLIKSYQDASTITATISFSRSNMMSKFDASDEDSFNEMKEEFSNIESLTEEEIIEYADSNYVSSYYYTESLNINSSLEAATSDFSFDSDDEKGGKGNFENNITSTDFTLMGYSSISAMEEFIEGDYTLSDYDEDIWNKILDGDYALINSELATLNGISVGDTIEIIDPNDEDNTYTLEVIGIFTDESTDTTNDRSMFSNSANTIITNTTVVSEFASTSDELAISITPYFILTSSDVIEDFASELTDKGLDENYTVTTNEDEINSSISSISNVTTFATTFLVITFIIGAIVLLIINFINIRERKYEIGVLRTIGMKKSLVACQFVLELLIVAIISLIIGATIGAVLSKPVSNYLLSNEIESTTIQTEEISDNFGGKGADMKNIDISNISGVVSVQAYDTINAVVNIKVILELVAICILLTLISSIAAISNIVRFKPLNILKERS